LLEDVDKLYTFSGYYEITGAMGRNGNSFTSGMRGPNDIVFADGHRIRFG
jgi:hypothetical protein